MKDDKTIVGEGEPLQMFPSDLPPRALDGFEILKRLGSGSAGEVFLARSRGGKLVAIKTIRESSRLMVLGCSQGNESSAAANFIREASVCARLRHPCIVEVRAFLEEAGVSALVFEYVSGVALARLLRECESRGVRLPDSSGWHIVERVLRGLAYAHAFCDENGKSTPIVHRDLSPSNVLLGWDGAVKIADFGIAKVVGVSPVTRLGLVKGTPGCMAPEQARGEAVDERADVYAAGLLAWRLATGRSPFGRHQRDEIELLRAMRHPNIPTLAAIRPDLPASLLDAVSRALEPDPKQRIIRAADLADIVTTCVRIEGAQDELRLLLERRRPAMEREVRSSLGADTVPQTRNHTQRYEEAALAFDDQSPLDGPTFEAHALPSEISLDAAPQAELDVTAVGLALPPDLPKVAPAKWARSALASGLGRAVAIALVVALVLAATITLMR